VLGAWPRPRLAGYRLPWPRGGDGQLAAVALSMGRTLVAEMRAPHSGSAASSIGSAREWTAGPAMALWAILAARARSPRSSTCGHGYASTVARRSRVLAMPAAAYALGAVLMQRLARGGDAPWATSMVYRVARTEGRRGRGAPH
jgi:hypothetical protein